MKIVKITKYIRNIRPPSLQYNGHLQTIFPALFRKVRLEYIRERIETPDGDYLDLDWVIRDNDNLVIICHGLEGSSQRAYIQGMAKYFSTNGWSALAWNFRGCSGDVNRKLRFYHSGATDDLETIIHHVNDTGKYNNIFLVGFSLGGNLMLKYLGEKRNHKQPSNIKKGVVFSVPLDLYGSCLKISEGLNGIYGWRFVQKLKTKIRQKAALFPDQFNLNELKNIRGLIDFDNRFTAPIHGFTNAMDYYQRCSALQFVQDISIPVLIVNALNDPFLSDSCYPKKISGTNPKVQVLTPAQGGHCGFADRNFNNHYWSEVLAWNYLKRSD